MIVVNKTTIGFKIPEEYKHALKFGEEHKDWIMSGDTMFMAFKNENTYSVELKKEDDE